MKKLILISLITGIVFSLNAETLYEWNFDDNEGTETSAVKNQGILKGTWHDDFEDTATNGDGVLQTTRGTDGVSNVYVPIAWPEEENLPEKLWVVIKINEWNFRGRSENETIRIGLTDSDHESRPRVVAQVRMERTDKNQVSILAEAFGSGSYGMSELPLFSAEQTEPLHLVLQVDFKEHQFELFLEKENVDYHFLGEGSISPERSPRYLRLGLAGNFGASDESFSLDHISLITHNPLLENDSE